MTTPRRSSRFAHLGIAFLLQFVLSTCGETADPARVPTTIVIKPSTPVALTAIGATQQLVAVVKDQMGDTLRSASVSWSTSNADVATVTPTGLVTAAGNGRADIVALTQNMVAITSVTVAQAAAEVVKVSGDAQTDTVGRALPQPIVVQVNDATGHPMAGVNVTFATMVGSGSVGSTSATTDTSGLAQSTWTLATNAGTQTASASVDTFPARSFTATAIPGAPASVTEQAGDLQTGPAGHPVAIPPAVVVRDAFDNLKPGATVTFATTPGNGSVDGATQTTNASGVAIVGSWTLGNIGINTLHATVTGSGITGNPVVFTATSEDTVPPSIPTSIALTPATPFTLTAIDATWQLMAVVKDQNGNPLPGASVTWSSSNAAVASVSPTGLVTAGGNGSADITAISGSLSASVTGTVAQTPVQLVKVSGNAQTDTVGQVLPLPLVVQVNDATGHPIAGANVTFAAAVGSGSVGSPSPTTNAAGRAQSTWTLGTTAGSQTASATAGTLPVQSFTATATPDVPASVAKQAGDGQTAVSGQVVAVRPAVVVRDAYNNLKPGATVTFTTSAGNGSVTGATQTTNASGIATVGSWTLGNVGTDTLRATVTGSGISDNPAVFTATSVDTLAPPVPATIAITPSAAFTLTTLDVTQQLTAVVNDQYGDPFPGAITIWSTNNAAVATVSTTGLVTAAGNGSTDITATSGSLSASVTVTVAQTPAQLVRVSGNAQTDTVGQVLPLSLVVQVNDATGHPIEGVPVIFAAVAGSGSVGTPSTTTDPTGRAQSTWTVGTTAGTQTATATAGTLPVQSFNATATPGAPASVTKHAGDSQTASTGQSVAVRPAVIVRDAFNNLKPGATVTFETTAGNGSVSGATQTTNASGIATIGSWTLGHVGTDTLRATVTGSGISGNPAVFTATSVDTLAPPVPTTITLTPATPFTLTALDVTQQLSAVVKDQYGDVVPSAIVTWLSSNASVATVSTTGLVTAAGNGSADITATSASLSAGVTVTVAQTPAQLVKVSGNAQSGTVGQVLPLPLVVQVNDATGHPIDGVNVSFAAAVGSGSVGTASTTTDPAGRAQSTWMLGTTAGPQSATATVGILPVQSFIATASPAPPVPTTIAITPATPFTLTAIDVTQQLTAVVKDQYGDVVPSATVSWLSSNASVATVGTTGLVTAAGNGSAEITATSGSLGAGVTVTVAQAAAEVVKVSGDAQTDTVGEGLPEPLVVQVNDATGHSIEGVDVTFAAAAGSGSVGSGSVPTSTTGRAQSTWRLGTTAGTQTATATVGTVPVQSFTATATPGAPASVVKQAGDGQTASIGQPVAVRPAVIVRDAFNNLKPGATVTFATTAGNGSVAGAVQTTNASGIATVGSWTLGNVGTDTLRATVTGSGISGNPAVFTATSVDTLAPPVPATIALTPSTPFTLTALDVTQQLSAVVKDQYGDVVPSAIIVWSTSSAAATVSPAGLVTAAGNGSADITATSGSLSASVTVTVAQTPAQLVKVSGDTQTDPVGQVLPQPLLVQVNDATGHPIEGVNVTFTAAPGSGTMGSPSPTTNSSGRAQSTWMLGTTAGGQAASATVSTLPIQSFSATAIPGAPASVAKHAGDGQTASIGQPVAISPAVIVRDAFNNVKPGATVTFTTTAGNGSVTGAVQTTNASGIAIVGSWTLGSVGTDTLRATVTGSGISGNPTVFTATSLDTVTPRVPTTIAITPSTPFTLTAIDATQQLTAIVKDQFGDIVPGAIIVWSTSSVAAAVSTAGLVTAAGNGSADITATSGSLSASVTVTVAQAAAQVVKVSGDTQTDTVGQVLPQPLVVQVNDATGHPIEGKAVTFAAAVGSGSMGSASPVTNTLGRAQTTWTLGTTAGAQTATATVGALPVQSFAATATPGAPASVAKQAGDLQTGPAGQPVPIRPAVIVKDAFNNLKPGAVVTFATTAGNGSVTGATQTTNASGIATVGSWTLGHVGTDTLRATVTGSAISGNPAIFTATSEDTLAPPVATTIAITPATPFTLTALDVTQQLSAVVKDQYGDVVPSAIVTWLSSNASVATVSSTGLVTAAANGSADITATSGSLSASVTATVAQTPAQLVKVSGNAQTDTVGQLLPQPLVVQVNDVTGHAIEGVSVGFAAAVGSGSVGSASPITNAVGRAQTTWTLGTSAGTQTATATVGTLPVQSFTATATPGAPASVAKQAGDGQTASAGQPVAVRPAVIVKDAFNNAKPGATVTFATTAGNGSVTGATQTTNASGIATVGSWTLGHVGTDTLRATVTGSGISDNPAVFTATSVDTLAPPVPATIALTPSTPFTLTALDVTQQLTAIVKDQYGDVVPSAIIVWSTSSAAATVSPAGLVTAAGNGSADITATSGSLSASVTVTVAQTPAQLVKVSGNAQTDTAGQVLPLPLVVQVNDATGHPIEGVTVTFAAAAGSGSVGSASVTTNTLGQAQSPWTLDTIAGPQNATATVGTLPVQTFTATATPAPPVPTIIAINPAAPFTLTAIDATRQLTAVVKDQYGDVVPSAIILWSTSSAAATVSTTGLVTAAGNGSTEITATSGSLSTSVTVTVAQAAAQIVKVSGDTQTDTVGQVLPLPLVVQVNDATGHPIEGVTVTFAAATGSGSMGSASPTTNASGRAQSTWTLGTVTGTGTHMATATVATLPVQSFTATATPGAPASVAKQAGDGQTAVSGEMVAVRPAVIVRDAFNNVKPGAVVTFATTPGNGAVSGATQTTDANGIATVGSWSMGNVGTNTLNATVTGSGISGNPAAFTATSTPAGPPVLKLVASGLNSALYVTAPPGDTSRVFVVQQTGAIRVVRNDVLLTTPFLNVSGLISCCGERGLLGLAFHPNYASNGFFYVYYTAVSTGTLTIARYHVSADPNVADPTGQILLAIPHPVNTNHNGGLLIFGPDGYLYIGTGDGGDYGDPPGNSKDSTRLLGKILRIDVDGAFPYANPPSNPFVGRSGADEVWAYGVRNPWRFTFDRLTRDFYIADVGEGLWEEIDFAPAPDAGGHNYGWNIMEGAHCFEATTCSTSGKVLPVYEYRHFEGTCSITGGYVYRGTRIPAFSGRYFFADFCIGQVRSLKMVSGVATDHREHTEFPSFAGQFTSFGEDARGELYITRSSGQIYRIVPSTSLSLTAQLSGGDQGAR